MTNASAVFCPQLLGEYESLRREHEELKVKNLSTPPPLLARGFILLFNGPCDALAPSLSLVQLFLPTEQFGVSGEQAVRR